VEGPIKPVHSCHERKGAHLPNRSPSLLRCLSPARIPQTQGRRRGASHRHHQGRRYRVTRKRSRTGAGPATASSENALNSLWEETLLSPSAGCGPRCCCAWRQCDTSKRKQRAFRGAPAPSSRASSNRNRVALDRPSLPEYPSWKALEEGMPGGFRSLCGVPAAAGGGRRRSAHRRAARRAKGAITETETTK
jgi:hypothetical protein